MSQFASLLAVATPSATTDPANTFYSPGIVGFLLTFFVVAGAVLLIFDMVRRVRRVRYRAEVQERLAAEAKAAESKKLAKPATEAGSKPSRPAPPKKPTRN
ncbi:MAG: hypothetical protein RL556_492 [Actinomycetota bacterium]|jgi:hypothetical protein